MMSFGGSTTEVKTDSHAGAQPPLSLPPSSSSSSHFEDAAKAATAAIAAVVAKHKNSSNGGDNSAKGDSTKAKTSSSGSGGSKSADACKDGDAAPGAGVGAATGASTVAGGPGGSNIHRSSKLGRKGDPRMHRAVAARLADPDMSLLDALRAGGFDFPECDEKGGTLDGTLVDSDNVQLSQRKNQLSRRLRLARQSKANRGAGGGEIPSAPGSKKIRSKKGNGFIGMPPGAEGPLAAAQNLSAQARAQMQMLIQHSQRTKTGQDREGGAGSKKRKAEGGASGRKESHVKRMLSLGDDEVEVIEEDPYTEEDEGSSESNAQRAKNHPLFQQRQPPAIPTAAWGAAAQLGLAGMAAAGAVAAAAQHHHASAVAASAAGAQTAAQQLRQAVAFGANPNTAAGAALAMAAQGSVPAAAQRSFSFWPSLAGMAAARGAVGAQQAQAQAAAAQRILLHRQSSDVAAAAGTAQSKAKTSTENGGSEGNGSGGTPASGAGQTSTGKAAAQQTTLALTAASLGMPQNQLAAMLGIGSLPEGVIPTVASALQPKSSTGGAQPAGSASAPTLLPSTGGGEGAKSEAHPASTKNSSSSSELETPSSQWATDSRPGSSSSRPDISSSLSTEGKMAIALDMLRTESASTLKRCMLVAGFKPSQTEECDVHYLKFAAHAAEEERKRIARIQARISRSDTKSQNENEGETAKDSDADKKCSGFGSKTKKRSVDDVFCSKRECEKQGCFGGRHVHRLEGKCGHQAVIHQPEGGQPHVDFIVDGKIECYDGLQGFKDNDTKEALWPSKYSCDQLTCGDDCDHTVTCGPEECIKECDEMYKWIEPKIYNLSDIDFDDNEWKKDIAGDESILGLMSLGDKASV